MAEPKKSTDAVKGDPDTALPGDKLKQQKGMALAHIECRDAAILLADAATHVSRSGVAEACVSVDMRAGGRIEVRVRR